MKHTILAILASTILSACVMYPVSTNGGYVYQAEVIPPTIYVSPFVDVVPYYGFYSGRYYRRWGGGRYYHRH